MQHTFADFAFIDATDGTLVEIPVTVSFAFIPQDGQDAPEIEDFRIIRTKDGAELLTGRELHPDETGRLVQLAWEHVGVERPILDCTKY